MMCTIFTMRLHDADANAIDLTVFVPILLSVCVKKTDKIDLMQRNCLSADSSLLHASFKLSSSVCVGVHHVHDISLYNIGFRTKQIFKIYYLA